ncbi:hypothetical protein ACPOL_0419 [Acidisarcina polymorpha]|uniref:Uncharacterized protein n=1 Tax=Acidisarcina polymorpha TaxID=2211140 RepID=A0A2Z5FTH1_9BACT|nr:hypothetical protein [Acidisarcina polymorpha]AXC09796.1 hypothetical protein ACPOL_0419 [Acidisarcina polymorpha]
MKASLLFRIAAVLIVLFAAGHTLGFRQIDPSWGIQNMLGAMKSVHFRTQGFSRTYWDFYVGFGLFVTVLLLLAAVIAWQLGVSSAQWPTVRAIAWALTVCFGLVVILSWRYFFVAPVAFCALIFLCLLTGTLLEDRALALTRFH